MDYRTPSQLLKHHRNLQKAEGGHDLGDVWTQSYMLQKIKTVTVNVMCLFVSSGANTGEKVEKNLVLLMCVYLSYCQLLFQT